MKKKILLISILFFPIVVFASGNDLYSNVLYALGIQAFISLHMSFFVLLPLSKIFAKENSKRLFIILFAIRAVILLFFDFFITTNITYVDFIAVFVGAFIVVPITVIIKRKSIYANITEKVKNYYPSTNNQVISNFTIKPVCTKCGKTLDYTNKFCQYCGTPVATINVSGSSQDVEYVNSTKYDSVYNNSEDKLLEEFIKKEFEKSGIDSTTNMLPLNILKRIKKLNLIFSLLIFAYICLVFFHLSGYLYAIGAIILLFFHKLTKKYDLINYLKKEIKSRPNEKMSNIVMSVKNSFVMDDSKKVKIASIFIAIILPLVIFMNPRIIYEKTNDGYSVRFYTFGLTNFKTAVIPEMYKGEKVVSLRGNIFSNMPFLKSVSLPNSIKEIRGQAFKNDLSLSNVNIPTSLEYLGGGSFYNCRSLKSITLLDTLTYMGGETFYGATSLKEVKLSNNLTEIRGNTFEHCSSLKSITIPDKVVRIGAHAFYGAYSLSEVTISSNSKLNEIGSSAFRKCDKLHSITIPRGVSVNMRAFKESPTMIYYFNDYSYNTDY